MEPEVQRALSSLAIDLDKSSPFAEYSFRELIFPSADLDVTVKHGLEGLGEVLVVPLAWTFSSTPGTSPAIYSISGVPSGTGYVKVRSTVAGKCSVMCIRKRTE